MAAALYNALWGGLVIAFPTQMFELANLPQPRYPALFQCIGMMVFAYAPGYWLVWKDPVRFGAFVWIGILGKVLGPVGFLVSAFKGDLPWNFGWLICLNDIPWLPAFVAFAIWHLKNESSRNRGAGPSHEQPAPRNLGSND